MELHFNSYISCEASKTSQSNHQFEACFWKRPYSGTVIKIYNMRTCLISIKSQLKRVLNLDKN